MRARRIFAGKLSGKDFQAAKIAGKDAKASEDLEAVLAVTPGSPQTRQQR